MNMKYIVFKNPGVSKWLAFSLVTSIFSFVCVAQLDSLPEGLPTDDIEYLGDNQFSSETFGNFELDTSIKNRVIPSDAGSVGLEIRGRRELCGAEHRVVG